jgi:DNA-binding response OmpR family regulator
MDIRILVVDDELDTLNLLRTILEISGYLPITTLNSTDAITLAEVEKPDVVLLDIMMPKLDGFTLCRMMRANLATQHLPIIFVTAYSALDLEDRRIEAGGDMVIHKPIDMDVLIQAIKEAIKMRLKTFKTGMLVPPPSLQPPAKDSRDGVKSTTKDQGNSKTTKN